MKYDFTSVPDRTGCGSSKWNGAKGASAECVPLSVADMEFYTAPPIKEALKKLVDTTVLGYTQPTERFYEAVCGWMKRRHDFEVEKEWIINTPGVVNALALLVDALTKPGDSVLILTPVYYPFDMAVFAKGRRIVYSELKNENGRYEIDFADLEKKAKMPKVKALLFCNPHNPIGRVWTKEELARVADICCDNGVFIIDDEIHHDLIMPGVKHTVMATVNERVKDSIAVCTAPSKTFNLAGVQCSNIIIPNAKARAKARTCGLFNMQSGLNIFAYTACIAAYNECEEWLDELLTVIQGNAKYVEEFMAEYFPEIKVYPLEGTYLQWLDMRGLNMTHKEMKIMLEDAGIYLDNGEMFGIAGRGFQRINLACARTTLEKAMARFADAVYAVRAKWKTEGKPYHKTLQVGDKLEGFVYESATAGHHDLAKDIRKPTLIVFSRYYECDVCRKLLALLTAAYPALKLAGYDVKFVMQSDVKTLRAAAYKYPFELIADPQAVLYDRYNVFEADGMLNMVLGDKLVEGLIGGNMHKLLDSDLLDSFMGSAADEDTAQTADNAAAVTDNTANTADEEKTLTAKPRQMQVPAFIGVNQEMTVEYVHYCRTMADFPDVGELVKSLKR